MKIKSIKKKTKRKEKQERRFCVKKVIIVGAGMAGSEAAWQVAQRGIKSRFI